MDSLHPSLSQALPLRDYDAEQALQAPFRAAALGIATFYKKASENGRKAYSLGYSSALQDLLAHLQTALDQLDSQHSQESMACTIQRIVDYIHRRQEALRAESQEPNEEDATQPSSAGQHPHPQSTTPPSHNTLSPTDHHPQPAPAATHSHQPTSSSSSSSNVPRPLETVSSSQVPRRRTSPRRMTPVTFQPTSSSGATFGVGRAPSSPSSASGPSSRAPFNLNFSSFAAVPLPQHHPPSHTANATVAAVSSGRRHRGAPTEGRKGKVKERSAGGPDRVTASSTQDSSSAHGGYTHYGPSSPSSADSPRPLALLGTKRRFPADSPLAPDLHLSPAAAAAAAPLPPQPLRITRRSSNLPKSISAGPTTTNASPATPPALDPHFSLHHHHHDQDDVLMVLQGPGPGTDDGIERASKRFLACKNRY